MPGQLLAAAAVFLPALTWKSVRSLELSVNGNGLRTPIRRNPALVRLTHRQTNSTRAEGGGCDAKRGDR